MFGFDSCDNYMMDFAKQLNDELDRQLRSNFKIQLEKEILNKMDTQNNADVFSYNYRSAFSPWGIGTLAEGSGKKIVNKDYLIPTKIIYNDKTTVCYFKDSSKEVVHCAEGEEFVKEVGVMSCIMKKLFNTRNDFKRLVNARYVQPEKKTK